MRLLYTWYALACVLLLTGDATAFWWRRRQHRARVCDRNRFVNGCTLPVKWLPYKKTFRPACNKHDVCYTCAAAYGISRASCDDKFHHDMRAICGRRWLCKKAAKAYAWGTKKYGRKYFNQRASPGCRDHWVKQCL